MIKLSFRVFRTRKAMLIMAAVAVILVGGGALAYANGWFKNQSADTVAQQIKGEPEGQEKAVDPTPTPLIDPGDGGSEEAEPTPTPTPSPSSYFTLKGTAVAEGVSLAWDIKGHDYGKGFKLMIGSTAENLGWNWKHLTSPTARSHVWKVGDGFVKFFKVCTYMKDGNNGVSGSGACSNTISLDTNKVGAETSGFVVLQPSGGSGFHLLIEGYAPYGFRLVWSNDANPAYPDDTSKILEPTMSNATSGSIPNVSGTWHVRACMITADDGCSNYSEEKVITLP